MLITAGPTHEPIDRVRYIANRSSGKLGVEIARAASHAGWSVTLLLGPVIVETPPGIDVVRFETCEELQSLLEDHFASCDVLVMAAAVADFRLRQQLDKKVSRCEKGLTLDLVPTPDLVARCCAHKRNDQFVVGFALESSSCLETRAREKLSRKGLDAIVANPLSTMGSPTIDADIFIKTGDSIQRFCNKTLEKNAFAHFLIQWIEETTPKRP